MIPSFGVHDKVFVITGGAGILCSQMARSLAEAGAKVAILDLAVEKARTVADEINAQGGCAEGFGCNVLKREDIEIACTAVLERFGRVDCLLNGAGGNHPQATADDTRSFFDIPEERSFRFNPLGAMVWDVCDGNHAVEEIKGIIMKRSKGDEKDIEKRLIRFINRLSSNDLITLDV
jgi:NAD(P)-dependent dehydrogenase (short-subunit alcohol dehydrogenase family)